MTDIETIREAHPCGCPYVEADPPLRLDHEEMCIEPALSRLEAENARMRAVLAYLSEHNSGMWSPTLKAQVHVALAALDKERG